MHLPASRFAHPGKVPAFSLLLCSSLLAAPAARAQTGGTVDPGFTPPAIGGNLDDDFNPAGSVQSVSLQQADGKLLLSGSQIRGIVRLNADGTRDTAFAVGAGADGTVSALVQQPDGSVLIGGDFTTFNGVPAPRLARLNPDGTIDPVFKPQVAGGAVRALAVLPNGQLAVGGEFTQVAQAPANSLVRLNADGSPDRSFSTRPWGRMDPFTPLPSTPTAAAGSWSAAPSTASGGRSAPTWARSMPTAAPTFPSIPRYCR